MNFIKFRKPIKLIIYIYKPYTTGLFPTLSRPNFCFKKNRPTPSQVYLHQDSSEDLRTKVVQCGARRISWDIYTPIRIYDNLWVYYENTEYIYIVYTYMYRFNGD